jgi:hypothetical protein
MRYLKDVLEDEYGLDLTGWTFVDVKGISADGSVIVGIGENPDGNYEAWVTGMLPQIECPNQPPSINVDQSAVNVDEGQVAANNGSVSDPDQDYVALSASIGTVSNNDDGTWSWNFLTSDGPTESQTVTITADDGNGGTAEISFDLTLNNVAPSIDSITVPLYPVNIENEPVSASATFNDPAGVNDEYYTCSVNYGDNSGDELRTVTNFECIGPDHEYCEPGVFSVSVTVTDKHGGSGSAQATAYIVIYDPYDGFVTSGGWINSPEDACQYDVCTDNTTGKANFGLVSKYKRGASEPTGQTLFQL